jgi:tyrosine-protein phosphatase YwqE
LNILSLTGGYGKEVQRQAQYLLSKGWYDFVGTDLHNIRHLELLHDAQLISLMKKVMDTGNIRNSQL